MKVTVSNEQRAGLAMFLANDWGGPLETLVALDDAFSALRMGELMRYVSRSPLSFAAPDDFDPKKTMEVSLSEASAQVLVQHYAMFPTPSGLGPSKVKLLKALQSKAKPAAKEEKNHVARKPAKPAQ